MSRKWRLIELEVRNPYENMGVDEAIMKEVQEGNVLPTIRFYRWRPSAVSIGIQQKLEEHVDLNTCTDLGIDVVRRISGGGTVFHDYEGEITYSVIGPGALFPSDLKERFQLICGWIIRSLRKIGLEAAFEPINDVTVNGKKISGSAQTMRGGVMLQHGTILYDMNLRRMFSVIKVGKEKLSKKKLEKATDRVTSVKRHKDISRDELYKALKQGFLEDKKYEVKSLRESEIKRAKELASRKYSTDEWNFRQ